jgi:hypothetical protein
MMVQQHNPIVNNITEARRDQGRLVLLLQFPMLDRFFLVTQALHVFKGENGTAVLV